MVINSALLERVFGQALDVSRSQYDVTDFISKVNRGLKGVFSKPSGKHKVAPNLCLLSYRLQILATCLFFKIAKLWKV